jgi:hypothetical protein
MEAFAGASTVVRGNCSFGMFSNYPENVDDALRQRAGARWLVDGPQIARGLHRHLCAAGGQEPFDPAGIARPLRQPGNQAGSGAILRRP